MQTHTRYSASVTNYTNYTNYLPAYADSARYFSFCVCRHEREDRLPKHADSAHYFSVCVCRHEREDRLPKHARNAHYFSFVCVCAGMNEKIGLLSYRMDRDQFNKPYSNETAQMIDHEVSI